MWQLFPKSRCYVCGQKDLKSNMENVSYGIYSENRYVHLSCVKSVICEPEKYGHAMVDRALWSEDCLATEASYRNAKLKMAQARICD